ncbi:MAG: hypothetical protein ACI4WM_03835 [Erysipelotrichaceae bacterium]
MTNFNSENLKEVNGGGSNSAAGERVYIPCRCCGHPYLVMLVNPTIYRCNNCNTKYYQEDGKPGKVMSGGVYKTGDGANGTW